jgi:hypothetical protein
MINSQNLLLRRQPKRITESTTDISREDILSKGIVTEEDYLVLENSQEICFKEELKLLPWIDWWIQI